jgi:hypothetical protein
MLLSWIPILGPIINGIVSIVSKLSDTAVAKAKIDSTVTIAAMETSERTIRDTQDDLGVRLTRDLIMFPVAIWTAIITWDNIVVKNWKWLYIPVAPYPPVLAFLPYAVITFLFGWTAINLWKRK